jgi:hypothetical protein
MQLHDGGQNDGRNDGIITHIARPHTCSKGPLSPGFLHYGDLTPNKTVFLWVGMVFKVLYANYTTRFPTLIQ